MADIIKTKAQLITAFADNSARDITAQTHRDKVVSLMSCTGQQRTPTAPLAITVGAVPIVFSVNESESGGLTLDPAWTYIDIDAGADGIYLMGFDLTLTSNIANNSLIYIGLYLNAAAVAERTFVQTNINNVIEIGGSFLTPQLVSGDRIQLGIRGSVAGTIAWTNGLMFLARQASTPIT